MWLLAAGVLAAAVALEFVHDGSARNMAYEDSFTERRDAPGNAYSSLVYAALALYLARLPAPRRPLARASEAAVLVWFAYLSFRYHHTTSRWHGALDLWCVTYLCVSCLSRYLYRADREALAFTWVFMIPLLLDVALESPDHGVVVSYNLGILIVLVYLLLSFSVGKWRQFTSFTLAFAAKIADMVLARAGYHTSSPLNGTSAFHLLTGLAMYYHYRDEIASPAADPTLEEQRVHEFGAGYDKSQRWQDLQAGLASPTPQERKLME